jgi:hypothetical protein
VQLVLLHGAPATGKYTVGRELALQTGFELYHNHLVVDDVLKRHAFGTPGFVAERDRAWREHLTAAARDIARRIIFTFSPENTVPQAFLDWLFGDLVRSGVTLYSVGLVLPEAVIEARLATNQRKQFKKLHDVTLYRQLRAAGAFATPRIPRNDLVLNTESTLPAEAAACIVRHFKLT